MKASCFVTRFLWQERGLSFISRTETSILCTMLVTKTTAVNETIFSLKKKIPKSYLQCLILIIVIPFKAYLLSKHSSYPFNFIVVSRCKRLWKFLQAYLYRPLKFDANSPHGLYCGWTSAKLPKY